MMQITLQVIQTMLFLNGWMLSISYLENWKKRYIDLYIADLLRTAKN